VDQRIPLRNPTFAARALTTGSAESLLLQHVNGILTVEELGILTGLEERVVSLIAVLEEKGAVVVSSTGEHDLLPPPTLPPVSAVRNEGIDAEKAHRIRVIFRSLSTLNHYELLGVTRGAEKAEIKQAYYHLVSEFHPDRLFGKRVGELRSQLELIFRHVTEAHDVLMDAVGRAMYDAELPPSPPGSVTRSLHASARSAASLAAANGASPPISIPPPPSVPVSSRSRELDDARKRMLAAKLGGGKFRSQPPPAPSALQHPNPPSKQGSTKGT